MKKVLTTVILLTLLTGCKGKVLNADKADLKCSKTTKNDVLKIDDSIEVYKSGEKITKISSTLTYEVLDNSMKENIKDLFDLLKAKYGEKNIQAKVTEKGNKYSLKAEYTPEEYNSEKTEVPKVTNQIEETVAEEFVPEVNNQIEETVAEEKQTISTNINEYKKMLETSGYTCK